MKTSSDFRRISREALRGKWLMAVLAGLVANVLGGISTGSVDLDWDTESTGTQLPFENGNELFGSITDGWNDQLTNALVGVGLVLLVIGLAVAVVYFVLGSVVRAGYCKFNLDLVDGKKEPEIGTLFSHFSSWKNLTLEQLLETLYVVLWSLLFIIPGIVAGLNYAMTGYIMAENPQLSPREALARSKEMMRGNRWRLICLHFSFFGWALLCVLTLGIGTLWLTPYQYGAEAAFYREISGTEAYKAPVVREIPEEPWSWQ